MNIKQINNFNVNPKISFGHYLDDEKSKIKNKISDIDYNIYQYDISKQEEIISFHNQEVDLNNKICATQNEVKNTKSQIYGYENILNQKKSEIENEKSINTELINKINNNNVEIRNLQKESAQIYNSTLIKKQELENELTQKMTQEMEKLNKYYEKELQIAQNGLKSFLINKIINPTILAMDGENINLPSSVCLEDIYSNFNDNVRETTSKWLALQAGVNYTHINAQNFQNFKAFIKFFKEILINASQNYDKTGKYTFTIISNINEILETNIKHDNKNFIQEVLEQGVNLYHNVIIGISNITDSKVNNKFIFSEKIKVDKNFISDKYFGLPSLLKELKK